METKLTTLEMLKSICDKIGFPRKQGENGNIWYAEWFDTKCPMSFIEYISPTEFRKVDEREIIFTQEFIDKFKKYYFSRFCKCNLSKEIKFFAILNHLDNPTEYLYNLIN